jgi:hypothetical protein
VLGDVDRTAMALTLLNGRQGRSQPLDRLQGDALIRERQTVGVTGPEAIGAAELPARTPDQLERD